MTIKKYLPIKEKIELINSIVDCAIIETEDNLIVDELLKEVAEIYYIVKHYTDFEFIKDEEGDESILENYDKLVSEDLYTSILLEIPSSEIRFIREHVTHKCYDILSDFTEKNSFTNIIKKILKDFSGNIPQMVESLKNVSPENFKTLSEMLKLAKGE
jgi:hypothetical protein